MKSYRMLPGRKSQAVDVSAASLALAALMAVSATGPAMAQDYMSKATTAAPRIGPVPGTNAPRIGPVPGTNAPRLGAVSGTRLPDEMKIPLATAEAANRGPLVQGEVGPGRAPCPHPVVQTISASGSIRNPADFPASWNGHYGSGLNDMNANHIFGYTFQTKWPDPQRACCEVVGAVLTFTATCHGDIPENDAWAIMHNGAGVAGSGGALGWSSGCNGQSKTISWTATPAVLALMNANSAGPSLSFGVEDDTAVTSATLQITQCCVQHRAVKPGDM